MSKETKEKIENCEHEFGHKVIGGFPGHEHIHPTGYQICFNCGKTFEEILAQEKQKWVEKLVDYMKKLCWSDKDIEYLLRIFKEEIKNE